MKKEIKYLSYGLAFVNGILLGLFTKPLIMAIIISLIAIINAYLVSDESTS